MEKIIITGKIERHENGVTVYTDGKIYGLARRGGDWGMNKIGGSAPGGIITAELYHKWENECSETGTFVLTNDDWERIE